MSAIGLVLWITLAADPAAAEPTPEQLRFFETAVRPIFVEHCQKCHGEKKQRGNLRLDSREALLRGGDSGGSIVPGKPEMSRLIRAVRYADEDLQMPPDGKLSDRQIADLTRWIEMGAPYPADLKGGQVPSRDPNHWSFTPPGDVAVPVVKDTQWPKSPIDNFILAKLEVAGLRPAPPADKRTLIRRVTFDLVGLPPTPEEIAAFLEDDRPDAYARLVDRLLESPAYGERWGRHWLDVARYADSNGLDENKSYANAWRYRDYVVASFNSDKPYDRFIVEQLAGDLLPAADDAARCEQLVATGFLGIGPKVLAEVDDDKMQADIVDEQIETTGRAFLGMSLGCARCHDHKFDPIDTADYYGLAGILKSTRTVYDNKKIVADWVEHKLPSAEARTMQAEYDAKVAAKREALGAFVAKADEQARQGAAPDAELPEKLEKFYPEETRAELKKLRDDLSKLEKTPPELPSAMGVIEKTVVDAAINIRGDPLRLGAVIPRRVPAVMRGPVPPQFSPGQSGRLELARWLTDARHPLTSRVIVNRIWRWHFGKGLSRTPDNFGLQGEPPTHPELLDWLANQFVSDGWTIKSLHRLILNSSTYRQTSSVEPEVAARDPENRLFGRMDVRRLEAEALRDALQLASGKLDMTRGGPVQRPRNREYVGGKDTSGYASPRRAVYLPVIRNNVYDLFQLLDYPDAAVSSGDRATTTVAPQALLMLNSEFIMQCAADFARRLLDEPGDDDHRLERLCTIAYGREPSSDELTANRRFLAELENSIHTEPDVGARRRRAWTVLCHAVLASNEFIYVN